MSKFLNEMMEHIAERMDLEWMQVQREKGWHTPEECPHEGRACAICKGTHLSVLSTGSQEILKCCDCGNKQEESERHKCWECHPCLCPWAQKADKEKVMARQNARVALETLETLNMLKKVNMQSALFDKEGTKDKEKAMARQNAMNMQSAPFDEEEIPKMLCNHVWRVDGELLPTLPLSERVKRISLHEYVWLREGDEAGEYDVCPHCQKAVRMPQY